jgi:hypothetical protein
MANKFSDYNLDDDDMLDAFNGIQHSPPNHSMAGSRRSFINLEPNISVRPQYEKRDFDAFRSGLSPFDGDKQKVFDSIEVYENVGIISTIIDMMADFGSQGVHIVHEKKSSERFLRSWAKKVHMEDRSERFLNGLYKTGVAIPKRKWAKITLKEKRKMARAGKKRIPIKYSFLNPLAVSVKDPEQALYTGKFEYVLRAPSNFGNKIKNNSNYAINYNPSNTISGKEIPLSNDDISVYNYKKDDWKLWGRPLVAPILSDIAQYEQMKLADMSALDGAISNIRLWSLGHLDGPTNSIFPTTKSINRLRDILASNVGGGTMDLVWGPELKFQESATELYKWLGMEKYGPVLNAIYSGMGVPPTMTGMSEASGSFTNNFVSLKVLIDRLEYGRKMLTDFWENEIKIVSEAMGITGKSTILFDHMALHDEAAEKNLLIQLVDRGYMSIQTLQDRFKEDPEIETRRIQRETQDIEDGLRPPKASPYHNPQTQDDLEKIALQKGLVNVEDVGLETTKSKEEIKEIENPKPKESNFKPTGRPEDGRPKQSKDKEKRKQRRVLTKAEISLWTNGAFKKITKFCTEAYLSSKGKKNLRCLNKAEASELEMMKFLILSYVEPFSEINEKNILDILESSQGCIEPNVFAEYTSLIDGAIKPSIEDKRKIQILAYVNKN